MIIINKCEKLEEPSDVIVKSYEDLVEQYIRERYTLSEELALNRQRDTKPTEFQEYFDYCEQCKARAREETE